MTVYKDIDVYIYTGKEWNSIGVVASWWWWSDKKNMLTFFLLSFQEDLEPNVKTQNDYDLSNYNLDCLLLRTNIVSIWAIRYHVWFFVRHLNSHLVHPLTQTSNKSSWLPDVIKGCFLWKQSGVFYLGKQSNIVKAINNIFACGAPRSCPYLRVCDNVFQLRRWRRQREINGVRQWRCTQRLIDVIV
jgi:hypothetical protein